MFYPRINNIDVLPRTNLAIELLGHRIHDSQTLYEYLIEFLLIYVSPKGWGKDRINVAPYEFPDPKKVDEPTSRLFYTPIARMGLKRFIFFERSKQEHRFRVDRDAYDDMMGFLELRMFNDDRGDLTKDQILSAIQDLFYGFTAVLKNRAWFAQTTLPLTPELTFCESIGSVRARKNMHQKGRLSLQDIDNEFEFQKHNFLARGGEVYFLHLLRGLLVDPKMKQRLEKSLKRLVVGSSPQLSLLAEWVQGSWLEYMKSVCGQDVHDISIIKSCEWIPEGYSRRSLLACQEVANLLEAQLPDLQKFDLLAKGIVLQILRMMHEQAGHVGTSPDYFPIWVVQIGDNPRSNMRRYSVDSYRNCEEDFVRALDKMASLPSEINPGRTALRGKERIQEIQRGSRHSYRLFRKLAKEIELVVPPRGKHMRFSLDEDLVKFFVLSSIQPGKKMLFSQFLRELHHRFGIVIGPDELAVSDAPIRSDDLDDNRTAFQEMLKQCGFLRDLSDATSIVENPFGGVF